jgi:hypothetical protein
MRSTTLLCCLLAVSFTAVKQMPAQDSDATNHSPEVTKAAEPPVHFYRLDIVIEQVDGDGKPFNNRSFSTMVSTARNDNNASTRMGAQVPIATGSALDGVNTQYRLEDVGINLDARGPRDVGSKLTLYLAAEITSLADATVSNGLNYRPIIEHNKWQGQVLIPIGKATTVFSSDDVRSKGSMRMLVTATLLQ